MSGARHMRIVLAALLLFSSGPAGANRWTGMASAGFTSCFARNDCADQTPCEANDFEIASDCFAECFGSGRYSCNSRVEGRLAWVVSGFSGQLPGLSGARLPGARLWLTGRRVSEDLFVLDVGMEALGDTRGSAEVAVFRFVGDPELLAGVEVSSVQELVGLGLIGPGDVLLVETFEASPFHQESFAVGVTGLPDDRIVIFGTGEAMPPDP